LSEIRANTVSNAAGTGPVTLTGQYAAKAWASFDQSPVTINQSQNVSSLTDNATGRTGVNYTNSFSYAGYAVSGISDDGFCLSISTSGGGQTASSVVVISFDTNAGANDRNWVSVLSTGDLA
jgi:hypothetical protein